jgi:antitoxin ParD1/3/4
MNLFRFTPQAEADLFDIWSYIASDNLESAGRVENAIYEACAFVADGPMRGRMRQDLTSRTLRF